MSLPFFLPPVCGLQQNADDTNIRGTLVTSGSAGVAGSYSQLVASLPYEVAGFYLVYGNPTNDAVFDIATGGAGAENVIIANLAVTQRVATAERFYGTYFPLRLAAGTRLSARVTATNSTEACYVYIVPMKIAGPGLFYPISKIETVGTIASQRGVTVTPSATANTFGSWAVIGTTVREWAALMIRLGVAADNNTFTATYRYQLGVGSAGSEQLIYEWMEGTNSGSKVPGGFGTREFIPLAVKAGSILSIRAMPSGSTATAGNRTTDAVIYGAVV